MQGMDVWCHTLQGRSCVEGREKPRAVHAAQKADPWPGNLPLCPHALGRAKAGGWAPPKSLWRDLSQQNVAPKTYGQTKHAEAPLGTHIRVTPASTWGQGELCQNLRY